MEIISSTALSVSVTRSEAVNADTFSISFQDYLVGYSLFFFESAVMVDGLAAMIISPAL